MLPSMRASIKINLGPTFQRASGKSSLIKAVFKVNVTVRFHTFVSLRHLP
jgi:hypothetical protein